MENFVNINVNIFQVSKTVTKLFASNIIYTGKRCHLKQTWISLKQLKVH